MIRVFALQRKIFFRPFRVSLLSSTRVLPEIYCFRAQEYSFTAVLISALGFSALGASSLCDTSEEVENWSGTHKVTTKMLYKPESTSEAELIIANANENGSKIRVVGNALSPNGIGLSIDSMITLSLCDKILSVDPIHQTVRVQAGASVQQVVDALRPYNMTLQNYASISEQQIGGFLQVGAHGTGVDIPPVDEQVTAIRLVTPALGPIELSEEINGNLFRLVKVGLGAFGLVTEVTIKCVPRHLLTERTWVLSRDQVRQQHSQLLKENRHIRYMWIPSTDSVVVVACNPSLPGILPTLPPSNDKDSDRLKPLTSLLLECSEQSSEQVSNMGFGELRDKLLSVAPLDPAWVARVNRAEAEFWKNSSGTRTDYSDRILGFDCGGQQWVNEVAFPVKNEEKNNNMDVDFVIELLEMAESCDIPAPSPIEQRWTAPSSAKMSPGYGNVTSWVGIIMYLPTEKLKQREEITEAFYQYRDLCKKKLWDRYNCIEHWAKLEMPRDPEEVLDIQLRLRNKYPVEEFNALRKILDPRNIMSNNHLDVIFGTGHRKI